MRAVVKYMKSQNKKNLICGEIGVMKGLHALSMLNNLDIKRLYLIDPYRPYIDSDGYIKKSVIFDKPIAKENLSIYYGKYKFVCSTSKKASKQFNNNFFDLIYIDANHKFKKVLMDLILWYPKVKTGGVIGGHDMDIGGQHQGVTLAVLDFIDEHGLQLIGIENGDYWMVKTCDAIKV